MAIKSKFTFKSDMDGITIHALKYEPEGEIKGIFQIVHGMSEHKERYEKLMEYLASKGYLCVIHDHRGHGQSIEEKNDLGYMYEAGWRGLIEDTHQLTVLTKENAKKNTGQNLPFFMLGHSMGSLVVRVYLKKYDSEIDKLIVMGTPSNRPGVTLGLILINILKKLKGDKKHSKILDYIVINSSYEQRYKSENTPHAWLSTDKSEVAKYNADPLCNYSFTINGYENLALLTKETYSSDGWGMENATLPIKFFSGEGDPCAVNKKAFGECISFLKKLGYQNVTGKMYKGMRHEVLNDTIRSTVYSDILNFIE